jgi:hypothetical protein
MNNTKSYVAGVLVFSVVAGACLIAMFVTIPVF